MPRSFVPRYARVTGYGAEQQLSPTYLTTAQQRTPYRRKILRFHWVYFRIALFL